MMEDGIDLRASDTYWCMADPGWALGTYATLAGPLLLGHSTVLYEGPFTVESTVRIIADAGVTNLAAAPTIFRMMRAADPALLAPIAGQLRCVVSGGEPLNAEVSRWGEAALGTPIHEMYGQTEMSVNVFNHLGISHLQEPGSAGLPSPGFSFAVLDDNLQPVPTGTPGILAVDRALSPLFFFPGYWNADTPAFRKQWYLTGDIMWQDERGYLFFVGRSDDVITSASYRIGPADVENAIIENPAVAEVAVIGKPDPERTEIVKAFIVLRRGYEPSEKITAEIQQYVRDRLSLHAYPREIEYLDALPKTPSGKVQRFVLRQRDRD
jgi:acetyl-CoA synthetase